MDWECCLEGNTECNCVCFYKHFGVGNDDNNNKKNTDLIFKFLQIHFVEMN